MSGPSARLQPVPIGLLGSRAGWLIALVLLMCLTGCGLIPPPGRNPPPASTDIPPGLERARAVLGEPRSGNAWFSGVWPGGGTLTGQRVDAFGDWRGTPADAATTYPAWDSWQQIHDSDWHISTFTGYQGVLVYGLPMLPRNDSGNFETILDGDHDWVYRKVAADLVANGRQRSIVRIGWEANGDWFPWSARAEDAEDYVASFRHIVAVMREVTPELVIDFDVNCGTGLRGQQDRLDALERLYPGDDVVDLVGCDHYDWYHAKATDQKSWESALRPTQGIGLQDVVDFARAHKKGLTFPEWGLASRQESGGGDNPYFISKMRTFFETNDDILVLESYFSEPETSIANSIWDPAQNPRAAERYRRLW